MDKRVIIIGAGFAGSACAWWLSRLGCKNVTVIEQEELPGVHASGLNAGLARRFEEDPVIAPLAEEGVDFILNPPKGFVDGELIECNGSLLLNPPEGGFFGGLLRRFSPRNDKRVFISKQKTAAMVPPLSSAVFKNAMLTRTDGNVDIHKYLWAFINGAKAGGVKFITKCSIKSFNRKERGIASLTLPPNYRRTGAMADKTFDLPADIVVNATGEWAQKVGEMVGAEDLQIKPFRRHLFSTPPMKDIDPKWPFVWDVKHQYYFRPESGGLLLGACDEEEVEPGTLSVNPKIKELLAEKLMNFCPALAEVSIAREWCGCRTFTPDKRPVIRFDKKLANFFWIAGLGGRGMTCSASAGRVAAEQIIKCMSLRLSAGSLEEANAKQSPE